MRVYHIQPFIDWGKAHVIMFVRDIPISNGKVPMSLEITGFGLHASASSEASGGVLTDFCWTVKCSGLEKCTFCGFWVKGCCAICSHSFTILVLMDPQILVICGIKHAFLGYNHIAFLTHSHTVNSRFLQIFLTRSDFWFQQAADSTMWWLAWSESQYSSDVGKSHGNCTCFVGLSHLVLS